MNHPSPLASPLASLLEGQRGRARGWQLDLPLDGSVGGLRMALSGAPGATMQLRLHPDGLQARIQRSGCRDRDGSGGGPSWAIDVRTQRPARLEASASQGPDRLFEPAATAAGRAPLDGLFSGALDVLPPGTSLATQRAEGRGATGRSVGGRSVLPAELRPLLESLQGHLASTLDPTAAQLARAFTPDGRMRWFAYEQAVNDPTGRVAQLARSRPGLLTLGRALCGQRRSSLWEELVREVQVGVRLPRLLERALAAWAGTFAPQASPGVLEAQRLRIARAGPLVPPAHLAQVPPPALVAEDIPTEALANRRWYEFQTLSWRHLAERLEPGPRAALLALASRSPDALLAGFARRDLSPARGLLELSDYLSATGRCPSRTSDALRLLDECDRWHRTPTADLKVPVATLLPAPWEARLDRWTYGRATVVRLRTAGELAAESESMRHCVASYARSAAAGLCQILHAEVGGEPLTLEVRWDETARCVRLRQTSGVANKPPTPAGRAAIGRWLGDLNAAIRTTEGREQVEPTKFAGRFGDGGRLPGSEDAASRLKRPPAPLAREAP